MGVPPLSRPPCRRTVAGRPCADLGGDLGRMGSARLLDDLSRALAEPMPRRRALRLLWTSLAVGAVPALRPGQARPASAAALEHCKNDQRECLKDVVDGTRPHYCCRAPSWKWACGDKRNGYRCRNTCVEGRDQFPCTATEEDPEAGINGECCRRQVHVGCHTVSIPERRIAAGTCETCPPSRPAICIPYKRGKGVCCTLGEQCCANEASSVCCGADQLCGYPRKRNGSLDPTGTVTCKCRPGSGTPCGRDCCEAGETCCGPPRARTCCSEGDYCFWKRDVDDLVGFEGSSTDFGVCKRGCAPGNRAGGHCCGAGYRANRRGTGCVPE